MTEVFRENKHIAIDILYSAFKEIGIDNSINYVVKQDESRNKRLRFLMHYLVQDALWRGRIFVSDNADACLLLNYPAPSTIGYALNKLWLNVQLARRTIGISRIGKVLKRQRHLRANHPKEPHIHPIILGVRHEVQNQGKGFRLVQQVMQEMGDPEYPVFIETTTRENIELYNHLGFEIIRETHNLGFPLIYLQYNKC